MVAIEWRPHGEWTDIRYETADGIAKITINRPEVRNAFRPLTTRELIAAFDTARDDPGIGVVILTGEGPEAFSSGGDQKIRGDDGYVDEHGIGRLNVLESPDDEPPAGRAIALGPINSLGRNVNNTVFIDYLTWHRFDGEWLITAKGYHVERTLPSS